MTKQRTLARVVQEELIVEHLTQQQLADRLGVSRTTVHDWLGGARPTDTTWARLVGYFGDRLPVIQTHSEQLRERVRSEAHLEHLRRIQKRSQTRDARAKAGATQRGKPKRKAGPEDARRGAGPRIGQLARSGRGQALIALGKYRRSHPDLDLDGLRTECDRIASTLDLPPKAVWAIWAPKLKTWGVRETGREPLHDRYSQLLELQAEWPGPVGARFYRWAAPRLGMLESDGDNLRRWRVRYERSQAALLARPDEDRITIPVAASMTGYSRANTWLMVKNGRLAARYESGVWWIKRSDVERLATMVRPNEVSADAAASQLGVTRKSVSRLVKRGRLVGRLVKGRLVVDAESLAALVSAERNAARRFATQAD